MTAPAPQSQPTWCPACSREVAGPCHLFNCSIGPNGLTTLTRCQPEFGCFSAEDREALDAVFIQHLKTLLAEKAARVEHLTKALEDIRDHWANQYDHPRKASEMYRGPYGIGITDGHRACAIIAERGLAIPLEDRS